MLDALANIEKNLAQQANEMAAEKAAKDKTLAIKLSKNMQNLIINQTKAENCGACNYTYHREHFDIEDDAAEKKPPHLRP